MATGDADVVRPAGHVALLSRSFPARSPLLVVVVVVELCGAPAGRDLSVRSLSTSTPRWTLLGDAATVYNDAATTTDPRRIPRSVATSSVYMRQNRLRIVRVRRKLRMSYL